MYIHVLMTLPIKEIWSYVLKWSQHLLKRSVFDIDVVLTSRKVEALFTPQIILFLFIQMEILRR